MIEEEIRQKAELKLDELDDWGFDFDEWSIQDTYIYGAVFGAKIATKELQEENKQAKEIIKKYLVIGVGGKITQNYLDVTKEAEAFLKED